jgi:hypothetical protein
MIMLQQKLIKLPTLKNRIMKNTQSPVKNMSTNLNDTSRDILQRHLSAFAENDLEAILADFTDESILITPDKSYTGLDEIKSFFADLVFHFPKQKSSFKIEKTVIEDELVYILWHGKTPSLEIPFATDTFIMKDGKIRRQTFAGQLKLIS